MNPFETLIHDLGNAMGLTLHVDTNQSCRLVFPQKKIALQIELDANAEQVLVGSQLGVIPPGRYRERIFHQAMRVNGASQIPRGILSFSEKNDTLILYQYLPLLSLSGAKLYQFVQLFSEHAAIWKEAVEHSEIPTLEEDVAKGGRGMFGLTS